MNALEELDSVGEFYVSALPTPCAVDSLKGTILVAVADGEDPNYWVEDPVELADQVQLVTGNGSRSVSFTGVTFEKSAAETDACLSGGCDAQSADMLTTAAIHLTNTSGWLFSNCTIRGSGGYGLWFGAGSYGNILSKSVITSSGAGAVRIGTGSATSPDCEGNVVADNVLSDGGYIYQQGCGVLAQKVGNTSIVHNEISHFRYTGISTGWTWGYGNTPVHDITTAFNHIHDIGLGYLSDMGCVYTLGHQPGSRVQNNLCHDVQSYNYVRQNRNLIYRCNLALVSLGGWGYYTDAGSRDEGKCSSFTFSKNVVYLPESGPGSNTSTFVDRTFALGLNNFTFTDNTYYSED
eukprot:gene2843-3441_t